MDMRVAGRVREAAEAVGEGTADWKALLSAWRGLGGGACATFLAWDKTAGELTGYAAVDLLIPASLKTYVDHFQAMDPLLPLGLQRPSGIWLDSGADIPLKVWRAGPYYADLMRPLRIEQTFTLTLCNDAQHIASISLHFDNQVDESRLRQSLNDLRPDLMRAFRARLQAAQAQRCLLDLLLSSDAEGWLLLDTGLRVRHACPVVEQLLSGAAALHVVDDRLCARHAALASRLAIAVAKARADRMPQTVHCAAGWGRVLRLALAPAPAHLLMFNEPLLLLRVQLLDAARLPDVDALRAVYGLTASEARLVRELVAGHS
ncbi:MAG: hypothetical protein LWW80_11995, partial [Thiomonas sp.]|nr:hypothetical protein [Thiomonas sp.]